MRVSATDDARGRAKPNYAMEEGRKRGRGDEGGGGWGGVAEEGSRLIPKKKVKKQDDIPCMPSFDPVVVFMLFHQW